MADRFPLIVNPVSKKIEELVDGDNLNLTGNGLLANGSLGISGQYLKSTGTGLIWDAPGDVYLTTTQTITNKTFTSCTISGSTNIFSNIPNTALVNSSITVNGVSIPLGGSVTSPDNNTTYSVSAVDGLTSTEKVIRLTSGGNFGAGVNDDVTFVAGSNVTLARTGDAITINSSFVDTDTVTRLQSATGGSLVSGDISIAAAGSSTVSQSGSVITISSSFTDTITRLRAGTGQTLASGDYTFLSGGATTLSQSGGDITISSLDTITRVRGSTTGTFNTGDITIVGAGASTVSQTDSTITVTSVDTNTVTRVRGTTGGTFNSGDITITSSGAATVSQVGNTINVASVDTNTTYDVSATGGLSLSGTNFSIKNVGNLTDSRVVKWDNSNKQLVDSIIADDGSAVTIGGDFIVTGTTTTLNTQTLIVADNEIEMRRGNNLVGSDGGVRLNRTTNSSGVAQTFTSLQWFEAGGHWRVYDGSTSRRLVTETETQILTNKTLSSPTLSSPILGIATATTINGLEITTTASSTFTIANTKTLTANNTVTLFGTDGSTINFRNGGSVAYTGDTLATFATTTSTQLRGIIADSTGTGVLVFNQNPNFVDSIGTTSTSFTLLNSAATSISAFGAATAITLGANGTGTTTIRHGLNVAKSITLNTIVGDTLTINGTVDFVNADVTIRGTSTSPFRIGRGGNAIASNTRVGFNALQNNSTGSQNTAVGFESSLALNSGASNTSYGYRALRNANTGSANTAVGRDAMLNLLIGGKNTAVGSNSLGENQSGNANVCIGHFAGYNCLGTGNVLIGPADDENSTNVTYQPPSITGDRQLVIGSGTGTWLRGDGNFDVTALQNFNVGGNMIVSGNLTINGATTTINSATLSVDDKTIEMGAVQNTNFVAITSNNSANITGVTPTNNLIPGMVVSINTGGISVPVGTFIVSITGSAAVLSEVVTGSSGSVSFSAIGPSDTSANGGGIVLKGTTNKSITWSDGTDAWTSTEHFDLAGSKQYRLGNVLIASSTQIGPSTGSFALGAGVTASSLTSVGTLGNLSVTGNLTVDTDTLFVDATNNRVSIGTTTASSKLHISGISSVSTTGDTGGILLSDTTTKTYPTTASFNARLGNYTTLEFGTSQTIDPVTPGGYNFVSGDSRVYTKSAGTTSDIERLFFNGFNQSFSWTDANTCKQYVGFSDQFTYFGIDANGRISSSINAAAVNLYPPTGGTQTISNLTATSGLIVGPQGTSTVNITNSYNLTPSFSIRNLNAGTKTVNITNHTFFGTSSYWGTGGSTGTLDATITNLYGLRLTAPSSSTGLTVTNNWGISQEWSNATNYFAGNIQMGAGKGIDFSSNANAAGMTSEVLDDYEEGTWTPTVGGNTSQSGQVYGAQQGTYTKIGRQVTLRFHIILTTEGTFSGSYLMLKDFPFTCASSPTTTMAGSLYFINMATNYITINAQMFEGTATAYLWAMTAADTSRTYVGTTDFTNTTSLSGTITYFT